MSGTGGGGGGGKGGKAGKAAKVDKRVPKSLGSTFLGSKVPDSVRQGMPKFHNMGAENAALLFEAAVAFILQGASPTCEETLDACQAALGYDDAVFRTVFTSAVQTLRAAARLRRKIVDLGKDLVKLNFPPYAVDKVTAIILEQRLALEEAVRRSTVAFPSLVNTRWRVDITICSSALARVMKPSVLMEFTLSTGEVKTFEVPQEVRRPVVTFGDVAAQCGVMCCEHSTRRRVDRGGQQTVVRRSKLRRVCEGNVLSAMHTSYCDDNDDGGGGDDGNVTTAHTAAYCAN